MKKIVVAVIFGGRSQEHDVSIISAQHIIDALKKDRKYEIIPVGISPKGAWYSGQNAIQCFQSKKYKALTKTMLALDGSRELLFFQKNAVQRKKIDVVLPWILGPNGEDGTLQGLLEIADTPYTGCGVFASAAGFNKALTKRVLESAGIPQVPYVSFSKEAWMEDCLSLIKKIKQKLGFPCFVKPASCGSSIGISKVKKSSMLKKGVLEALRFDDTIIIEKGVENLREIECAVLGNADHLTVSLPGEVHYEGEFYDYKAKYVSEYWEIDIPPKLPAATIEKIRTMAADTFHAIQGSGLARIDFLMNGKTGEIYLNELNTTPAFRSFGCYATLMKKVGVSYKKTLDTLIKIAFAEYKKKHAKKFDFAPPV